VNGQVVASQKVDADGQVHTLDFEIPVARSSWVALRQFPQLHTNPVNVMVSDRPIRTSRNSARWCQEVVNQLWEVRHKFIAEGERAAAREAYDRTLDRLQKIAEESDEGT
jgi:hypothetical protein